MRDWLGHQAHPSAAVAFVFDQTLVGQADQGRADRGPANAVCVGQLGLDQALVRQTAPFQYLVAQQLVRVRAGHVALASWLIEGRP